MPRLPTPQLLARNMDCLYLTVHRTDDMPGVGMHAIVGKPLEIDTPQDLDTLGNAASILGVGLTLVDPRMVVVWQNAAAREWFPDVKVGESHCFASHFGRQSRCEDCLPVLVFQFGEAREGLRVRGRPGESRRMYRVQALPVSSPANGQKWVLEALTELRRLPGPGTGPSENIQHVLNEAASSSSVALLIIDNQHRIVSWSPSAQTVFGYEVDEVLGRKIEMLVPEDRQAEIPGMLDCAAREERVPRMETVRKAKDGRLVPVAISAVCLRDEAGVSMGCSMFIEDLSEVQHLRTRLDAHHQLLSHVINEIGGAVFITDREGRITGWNSGAEALFGVVDHGSAESSLEEILGGEGAAAAFEAMSQNTALRGRRIQCRHVSGEMIPVDLSVAPIRDTDQKITGVAALIRDARETVRTERQMVRSEKLAAVGSLAAGLAHEIGTPLNIISATAEYLLLDQAPTSPIRMELSSIVAETERIGSLVADLLAFARESQSPRVPVSLRQIAERVLTLMRVPLQKKKVSVELNVSEDLPVVLAQPDAIHQVLVNLMLNAIEAVAEQGHLKLVGYCSGDTEDTVTLEVHDDGPGIPVELREQVFNPFFTTRAEGTGLGLAVCARIVESHKGDLRVIGSPLGGACFVLQLARAPEQGE